MQQRLNSKGAWKQYVSKVEGQFNNTTGTNLGSKGEPPGYPCVVISYREIEGLDFWVRHVFVRPSALREPNPWKFWAKVLVPVALLVLVVFVGRDMLYEYRPSTAQQYAQICNKRLVENGKLAAQQCEERLTTEKEPCKERLDTFSGQMNAQCDERAAERKDSLVNHLNRFFEEDGDRIILR